MFSSEVRSRDKDLQIVDLMTQFFRENYSKIRKMMFQNIFGDGAADHLSSPTKKRSRNTLGVPASALNLPDEDKVRATKILFDRYDFNQIGDVNPLQL